MTASIARFLKDFGEVPPPPPPEASGDFDFGGFPGSDAVVEEPVDIEAERAEAHAKGYEAATQELQAKWAEERQALLAAQQAEMAALKARYENEIVDLVQSKLGQIAITVAEAVSDQTAKVLAPLVEEALTDKAIADMAGETRVILVDIHAEATAEKRALAYHLDGRVSCVVGTHTHVQTADECILPGGTAFLTDAGMTGPSHSVIGMKVEGAVRKMVTQLPTRLEVADGPAQFNAMRVRVEVETGRAIRIERLNYK